MQFGVEPCVDLNPVSIPKECMVELRTWAACALTIVSVASRSNVIELINCKGFNTLAKLLRVTAQVLRAIEKFSKKEEKQSNTVTTKISEAELL